MKNFIWEGVAEQKEVKNIFYSCSTKGEMWLRVENLVKRNEGLPGNNSLWHACCYVQVWVV